MGHTVRTVEENVEHRYFNKYWRAFWVLLPKVFPAVETRRHRSLLRAAKEFDPEWTLRTDGTVPPGVMDQLKLVSRGKIGAWYADQLANLSGQYLVASDFDASF